MKTKENQKKKNNNRKKREGDGCPKVLALMDFVNPTKTDFQVFNQLYLKPKI